MTASIDIAKNLKEVLRRVASCRGDRLVRLVAVSKTKSAEMVKEAYDAGQRVFGENYVKEVAEKGNSSLITENCRDIQWHFVGNLQRNKVKKLLSTPNLTVVETVDSIPLANELQKQYSKLGRDNDLRIFVQVNTSGEEQKNGCRNDDEVIDLIRHVKANCVNLSFSGLMTIGSFDHDLTTGPNPDFLRLVDCRRKVCEEFGWNEGDLELSMGMSGDFEHAMELGSTNIRVGSTIFGARTMT